jgi:hypothetical protein
MITICLGTLTKVTFLPLAAVLIASTLFAFRYRIMTFRRVHLQRIKSLSLAQTCLCIVAVALLLANLGLHAYTFISYGSIRPTCDTIYSHETCMKDPLQYFFAWTDYMIEKTLGIFAYSSFYQSKKLLAAVELLLLGAICLPTKDASDVFR